MSKQESDEKIVPLGVVFITVGLIVVVVAASILFVRPAMGQSTAARSAALPVVTVVVTPVPNATATAVTDDTSTEISLPAGFVTLADAPRSSLANRPRRIVIPSIDMDAPVTEVGMTAFQSDGETLYQWQVPANYEAGWHNTSAPLGEPGNTVLNGHHNIFGEVFGRLVDLEVGAEIVVYDAESPHTYTVAAIEILPERDQPLAVRQKNAEWIQATDDERITLVTCWPDTGNSHRLIVVAYPINSN
ncbi:MAG: sortase [Anaerolineaceae bacterium]|nr:sortase [Anaerolineaceae bacterium]